MLTKLALEQAGTFAIRKIWTSEVKMNRMKFISVLYLVKTKVKLCFESAVGKTYCFLQTDLFELSHSGAEQSLQRLLPLLKSCDPLSLQLAVRAALNIYKDIECRYKEYCWIFFVLFPPPKILLEPAMV